MKRLPRGYKAQIQGQRMFQTMYTAEQMREYAQRQWQGLTEGEEERLIHNFGADPWTLLDEVNARLQKRNT